MTEIKRKEWIFLKIVSYLLSTAYQTDENDGL